MNKKVLVIAYAFPPMGGSGVQRTVKFVKYLPLFGWTPVVLTPKNPNSQYFDYSLVQEIPREVKIYRTISIEPQRWYAMLKKKSCDSPPESIPKQELRVSPLHFVTQIGFRWARYVAHNFIFIPDFQIGWIPFAVLKGLSIIRKERINVIYATGDPWSDFLIAFFLNLLTGRSFIMDMRDPWTLNPNRDWDRLQKRGENLWEKVCISAASKVINVTEQATEWYIEKYPIYRKKFVYIPQGFDTADFENVTDERENNKFIISCTSAYKKSTNPENFLQAVKYTIDNFNNIKHEIQINFMGMDVFLTGQILQKYGLNNIVKLIPYGSHFQSIQLLLSSDVLLLIKNRNPNLKHRSKAINAAKIFEYIAAKKPILAVVPPESEVAKIVRSTKAGIIVDTENVTAISETIYKLYLQHKKGVMGVKIPKNIQRFERRKLAQQLAKFLNQVSSGTGKQN